MSALAWWFIPLVATVVAVLFVMLRSRPAKPTTAEHSMERLRRMQEAMERPLPSGDAGTGRGPMPADAPAPGDRPDPPSRA